MLKNFKCNRCGSCCHTPRLYKTDIARIRKAGYDDFVEIDFKGVPYIKEKRAGVCFLKKEKGNM